MGAWATELATLLTGPKLNLAALAALERLLLTDTSGNKSLLGWFGFRAAIEAASSTTIRFAATAQLTGLPIIVARSGGRIAVLIVAPSSLSAPITAGTHYVYLDIAAPGTDGISTAGTLVESTTPPNSEATAHRAPVGQYEANGTAITAVTPYYPWQDQGVQPRYMAIVASAAPSPAFQGMLWFDTVGTVLKVHTGATFVTLGTTTTPLPLRHLGGLNESNNAVDPTNDIDIAVGAAVDDDSTAIMQLTSTLTKRLDAAWAVGTNQGGLDTGAIAASTWYYVWLIQRSDTGVVDALFSLSSSAPTLPTSYDRKRRIGSVRTDGAVAIRPFRNTGDWWLWKTPTLDVTLTNPGAAAVLSAMMIPPGFRVIVYYTARLNRGANDAGVARVYISSPDQDDQAPSSTAAPLATLELPLLNGGANRAQAMTVGNLEVWSDVSAQIRTRFNASDADDELLLVTNGYMDRRGR